MKLQIQQRISLLAGMAIIYSLCSCSRTHDAVVPPKQENSIMDIIERYYKVANTKVDGKFIFQSNLCNNDARLKKTATAMGMFFDKQGYMRQSDGAISIGGTPLSNHNGSFITEKVMDQSTFFGKTLAFQISAPTGTTVATKSGTTGSKQVQAGTPQVPAGTPATATATLYSPQPISITNFPARTPVTLSYGLPTIVSWNADANDPNGVVVIAEYIPGRYPNKAIAAAGNTRLIQRSELVSDDGSTSIPWSFFMGYPTGGHVILWVARGNYAIASDGTYNYMVGGYTAAAIWDVTIPPVQTTTINITNTTGKSGYTSTFTNTLTGGIYTANVGPGGGSITVPNGNYNITTSTSAGGGVFEAFCSMASNNPAGSSITLSNATIGYGCNSLTIGAN